MARCSMMMSWCALRCASAISCSRCTYGKSTECVCVKHFFDTVYFFFFFFSSDPRAMGPAGAFAGGYNVRSPCPRAHVLTERDATWRGGHSPESSLGGGPTLHGTPPVADKGKVGQSCSPPEVGGLPGMESRRCPPPPVGGRSAPATAWRRPAARLCLCPFPLRSPTRVLRGPRGGHVRAPRISWLATVKLRGGHAWAPQPTVSPRILGDPTRRSTDSPPFSPAPELPSTMEKKATRRDCRGPPSARKAQRGSPSGGRHPPGGPDGPESPFKKDLPRRAGVFRGPGPLYTVLLVASPWMGRARSRVSVGSGPGERGVRELGPG